MKRKFGRKKTKKPLIVILLIVFSAIIYLYYITEKNIKPMIITISEIKARLIATQAINEAVNSKVANNDFKDIIMIRTDNNGKVTLVQANTVEMNRLSAETSMAIQNAIKDIAAKGLEIPMSNIFGSQIFANTGPKIKINIQPAGSVNVNFNSEFEEAGINQTRLKIYLEVNTDVQIIVPLAQNKIDVATQIPVSETIIVGDVPASYITVPEADIPNYVPTQDPFSNK